MNNQKKAILIIVLAVLVIAVISILIIKKPQSPTSPLTNDNQESAGENVNMPAPSLEEAVVNNANPNLYSFTGDSQAEKVEVEFMSDTEKASLGIPTAARIQVLERDENGKCIAWKLINQDSEILHEYVK